METLDRMVRWLAKHNNFVSVTDEPYLPFSAEWQDWSGVSPGKSVVFLAYAFEQNSDLCFDPAVSFEIVNGAVEKCVYETWAAGTMEIDLNDPSVADFVEAVWQRHFLPRLEEANKDDTSGEPTA
jgi:hypothetical protein